MKFNKNITEIMNNIKKVRFDLNVKKHDGIDSWKKFTKQIFKIIKKGRLPILKDYIDCMDKTQCSINDLQYVLINLCERKKILEKNMESIILLIPGGCTHIKLNKTHLIVLDDIIPNIRDIFWNSSINTWHMDDDDDEMDID